MSEFPKIIGLAGQMGSGKDTAAAYLVDIYKYTRVAFADGVREEAATALADRTWPAGMPAEIIAALRTPNGKFPHSLAVYEKPTPAPIRALLQWWGTEYRRAQDAHYWVKFAAQKMQELQEQAKGKAAFAVSDVRYPNEAAMIREQRGVVWLIKGRGGDNNGIAGHSSEQLDWLKSDLTIDNSGRLEDLYFAIDFAFEQSLPEAA